MPEKVCKREGCGEVFEVSGDGTLVGNNHGQLYCSFGCTQLGAAPDKQHDRRVRIRAALIARQLMRGEDPVHREMCWIHRHKHQDDLWAGICYAHCIKRLRKLLENGECGFIDNYLVEQHIQSMRSMVYRIFLGG